MIICKEGSNRSTHRRTSGSNDGIYWAHRADVSGRHWINCSRLGASSTGWCFLQGYTSPKVLGCGRPRGLHSYFTSNPGSVETLSRINLTYVLYRDVTAWCMDSFYRICWGSSLVASVQIPIFIKHSKSKAFLLWRYNSFGHKKSAKEETIFLVIIRTASTYFVGQLLKFIGQWIHLHIILVDFWGLFDM